MLEILRRLSSASNALFSQALNASLAQGSLGKIGERRPQTRLQLCRQQLWRKSRMFCSQIAHLDYKVEEMVLREPWLLVRQAPISNDK
jgi:hypothetical protein